MEYVRRVDFAAIAKSGAKENWARISYASEYFLNFFSVFFIPIRKPYNSDLSFFVRMPIFFSDSKEQS
jgi:hypothetical protein